MSLAQLSTGAAQRLTDPRALGACERVGILPTELRPKARDDFFEPGLDPVILDMRAEHHEARRQVKLRLVEEELCDMAFAAADRRERGNVGGSPGRALAGGRGSVGERMAEEQAQRERKAKIEALARASKQRAEIEVRKYEERLASQEAKEESVRYQRERLAELRERKAAASGKLQRVALDRAVDLGVKEELRHEKRDRQRHARAAEAARTAAAKQLKLFAARAEVDARLEVKRRSTLIKEVKAELRQTELSTEAAAAAAAMREKSEVLWRTAYSARLRMHLHESGRQEQLAVRLESAERRRLKIEYEHEHARELRRAADAIRRAADALVARQVKVTRKLDEDEQRASEVERRRAIDRMLRREEKR
ncbi:hypothetical protein T492DRAFT_860705, partial [Pavlovales sp. CCMP2436]